VLRGRDEALLAHAAEDVALAGEGLRQAPLRVVVARPLRQPGQQRRLRDRQLAHVLVEELARRRGDAIGAGAEVDLIQIQVEDLVLGELLLQALREDGLLHLALEAPLGREEKRLDHLLRDGAAALDHAVARHVGPEGPQDARGVDPAVGVELRVLGREEREPDVVRNAVERHEVATLGVELADERAVVGEDARRDRRLVLEQLIDRRQVARDLAIEDEARDAAGERPGDRDPQDDAAERASAPLFGSNLASGHSAAR
jgi:hypothetical protein